MTGLGWVVAATLGLFILASGVAFVAGLMWDAIFDPLARACLGIVYALLFVLPAALMWFAFWHFGGGS